MMGKEAFLKHYILKVLIKRLLLATLVIAAILGTASVYHSKEMVYEAVIQVTRIQIHLMRQRLQEALRVPGSSFDDALRYALHYPPVTAVQTREGEFRYVVLFTEDIENIAEYRQAEAGDIRTLVDYIAAQVRSHPAHGYHGPEYNWITLAGGAYLEIHDSLVQQSDGTTIYLRGLFILSDRALNSVEAFTARNTLFVLAAVVTTAVLLYPVVTTLFRRVAEYSCELMSAHLETMEALGETIAKRDRDTSYHNYRVTLFAVALAQETSFDPARMKGLIKGAFLHDIGKIGVRDNILLTRERYNEKERSLMAAHVIHGLDIIRRSSWLQEATAIVGSHHERFDGTGYPAGVKGEDIPIEARIFAIVDVFDALTSKRPYKEPYSFEDTMELMLRGRGSHFDPLIFAAFMEIAPRLYNEYAGKEDDGLKQQFKELTDYYFHCDPDVLSG